MRMAYVKLFESILASTIWDADSATRIVWITMLAMADRDGIVESSVPGLAHLSRVSRTECDRALSVLAAPDHDSRTKDHEGRRISTIDGGWKILNYEVYRDRANAEEVKEKAKLRQQRKRERDRSRLSQESQNITHVDGDGDGDACASTSPSEADSCGIQEGSTSPREGSRGRDEVSRPDSVPQQVWDDYLTLRKGKRAKMTATALAQMIREAAKAGRTLEDVLTECVTRGWTGFKADWAKEGRAAASPKASGGEPDWNNIDYGPTNRRI